MKVKVLLFGVLAEEAGLEEMEIPSVKTVDDLKHSIISRYPAFNKYKFNISVNKTLVKGNPELTDGDEVALLPPFAGG